MTNFHGTIYDHIEHELKQLVNNKLIDMGDKPHEYYFINGFILLPLGQMIGQATYSTQVVTIGLMHQKTHEFRFFGAHTLLEEIHKEREKKEKKCSVTSISEFKLKKVEENGHIA